MRSRTAVSVASAWYAMTNTRKRGRLDVDIPGGDDGTVYQAPRSVSQFQEARERLLRRYSGSARPKRLRSEGWRGLTLKFCQIEKKQVQIREGRHRARTIVSPRTQRRRCQS
jgi:hypothetical protein